MSEAIKPHWVITKSEKATTSASELKRHDDPEKARKEAERLAAKEQKEFYIYKLDGVVRPAKPPIEYIPVADEAPKEPLFEGEPA